MRNKETKKMLNQTPKDLFDEMMTKLAELEYKNRGFDPSDCMTGGGPTKDFVQILEEMYRKFDYYETEIIKIQNGIPIPERDRYISAYDGKIGKSFTKSLMKMKGDIS